jgi:hypothetical protein
MFVFGRTSFRPSLSNFNSKMNPSLRLSGHDNRNTETQREALLDVTNHPAQNHITILANNAHLLTSLKVVEFIVSIVNTTVFKGKKVKLSLHQAMEAHRAVRR